MKNDKNTQETRDNKLSQVRNKSNQVRNKSNQVKNMSIIHIQRPLFLLIIPKALITATFYDTISSLTTQTKENKLSKVRK